MEGWEEIQVQWAGAQVHMCSEWLIEWSTENRETDLTGVHGKR